MPRVLPGLTLAAYVALHVSRMTISRKTINGYEEFTKAKEAAKGRTLVLFTGSKLPSGESWCPDCVEGNSGEYLPSKERLSAEPVIEKTISEQNSAVDLEFVTCYVGQRDPWVMQDMQVHNQNFKVEGPEQQVPH